MRFRSLPEASAIINRGLFLTGAMRTGTTMMARLIASLKETELFIEPPFSYLLVPMIEDLSADQWSGLFGFILFEDYLIPSLAGRNLNLNTNDLTYVGQLKSKSEIRARMSEAHGHADLVERSNDLTVGLKMPEMMPYVESIKAIFPEMSMLTTIRHPEGCITSMLDKKWYCDEGLYGKSNKWPLKADTKVNLPFWLPDDDHDKWCSMTETERCCYSYLFQYKSTQPETFNYVIDYEKFVEKPESSFRFLTEGLKLEYGDMTSSLLEKVSRQSKQRTIDWRQVSSGLKNEVHEIYDMWQSSASDLSQ